MAETLRNTIVNYPSRTKDAAQVAVLKTLAYFDVFQYPLNRSEIKEFLSVPIANPVLDALLGQLTADEMIFQHGHFYSLHPNPLSADRRINYNSRADRLLPRAYRIGKFLYRFPFVRGIGISGSLSKNCADENTDIDFFIITRANRLWIARTIMHLFKKLTYLARRQHWFCMNYYVDENALLLDEKNIYTAIEIKTLLPVSGDSAIRHFFSVNDWANEWLPACEFRKQPRIKYRLHFVKPLVEWIFDNKLGNIIDNYLMRITHRRWLQKEQKGKKNGKGLTMMLITGKHFARSNSGGFQEKVLRNYKQRLSALGIGE